MKSINDASRSTEIRRLPKVAFSFVEILPEERRNIASVWPEESLKAEQKFGHPGARLYPFLDKTVATPHGDGRLWQVSHERVGVVFPQNPNSVVFLAWYDVRPPGGDQ